MSAPVLGIDLGTTNSVIAMADGHDVHVLVEPDGARLTPSTVSFHPSGKVLVGQSASARRLVDAPHTVYSVKRLIGRPFQSEAVQRARARFPFALVEGAGGGTLVQVRGETYALPEISALILRHLKGRAERELNQPCPDAVITVPANFNELQRTATRDAGRIAGLRVLRMLNEPTAAALAYGFGADSGRQRIAIFDLGGGTFDLSVLELSAGVFEVVATAGDSFLGGDDIDHAIALEMAERFAMQHRVDLTQSPEAFDRLRVAAEWLKCQLSTRQRAGVRVEEVAHGTGGSALSLEVELDRAHVERLTRGIVGRAFEVCDQALQRAGTGPRQLDHVILVGGATRMPLVRRMVADYFGRAALGHIDPDVVVAQGAAIQGRVLRGELGGLPQRPTWRPPGAPASVPPAASSAELPPLLLDVTPHTLAIETSGGFCEPVIARDAPIPTEQTRIFTTSRDGQREVRVAICQGESRRVQDNQPLGLLELMQLAPGARGSVRISVTFIVDADGTLDVRGKDLHTGNEQLVRLRLVGALGDAEVARLRERHVLQIADGEAT